jgi:DNA-binding XRE family transcriptional regulator
VKKDFYNLEKEENLVKKTCRELGITQKELAEKIGVSNNSVSSWKNEKQPIPKWAIRSFNLLKTEDKYIKLISLLN